MSVMANVTERTYKWNNVKWRKVHAQVRNLRQRIFRATREGNLKKVRSLQKLMLRSHSNILASARRVTQINKGKYTPGVDKLVVKTPVDRGILVEMLEIMVKYAFLWEPHPAKRTYIPKKANGKKRPLGIPGIIDRCLQAIVKNALEPAWEAQFEGISYGFRPGRGPQDAMGKIFNIARPNKTKKWVLDADIKGCFDNINHECLEEIIGNFPARKLIHQWLKAGYMEDGAFHQTEAGTPQGGIISPLLANIALHGMEKALDVKYSKRGKSIGHRMVIRYADDFVVFCETKEDAEKSAAILTEWLKERGLTLSKEKTRIVHLSEGFNFLGFNVRHYRVSSAKTGWKLLIKPSAETMQEIRRKLRQIWLDNKGKNVAAIIRILNPIIRGIANYLRTQVSSRAFLTLDRYMFKRERRYANRMHPEKSSKWKNKRYWGRLNLDRQDNWVFGDKQTGYHLLRFVWFNIERHTLVRGTASKDDPNLKEYWVKREKAKANELKPSYQKVAKNQGYNCPVCGQSLFNDEELHLHHVKPRSEGGKDNYANLQLVHLYCHQQIHAHHKSDREEKQISSQEQQISLEAL